ncbi:MAG: hypothetical protein IJT73_05165 [Selenomonadaceae bacterium]|nr:hypothetical protein [Selenomonadaceae bacterium]
MRKIKSNKKDNEKKQKKVQALMKDLFHYHGTVHDEAKTLETVKAIAELEPDDSVAAEKVASIYIDYSRANEADKAVTYLEKKFPPTPYRLFLRSRVCDLKQDYGGCIKYSEKALTLPGLDLLTQMMIYNILGHAYRYAGDAPNSLKYYELSAKIHIPEGVDPNSRVYVDRIKREDYSNFLFSLHNVNVSREKMFEEIYGFNELYDKVEQFVHDPATHPRHEKLRIGYIGPDIRRHVVAFFSYAFYKRYDKSRFEVYIYAKNKEDSIAQDFKNSVDGFRNILFDAPQVAAQKIKDDEIDILVDLSGHTANNVMPVVAYKPAPIIISAIGWFNTTGFKPVDYFMVDKYTDPVGLNEKFFSEKMLRLQHSHFCYMWHDDPTVVNPAPCTKNGYVTFVSFNNFTKVTDEALRVWAKIVNAVPNAKLYLKGKAFRDKYGIDAALKRIEEAGLSTDKLIYEPDEQRYLHKYMRADIALDTFPYPGGGTTCDALYMGLPVITLVQERHNSRFGFSLLTNCGLGELCAFSEEEYIQKAVELANDWDRIREYHLTIRRKMEESPVMNDAIYMGEVEDAYEKIFNAWINGEELPEFPQDAPPVTPEQAEFYYNRAKKYIEMEPRFQEGKFKNAINVKRALYNLELAMQSDHIHDAEIFYYIAICKKFLLDYAGAYEAISKTGKAIYESGRNISEFSNEFLARYHKLQGQIELLNGNPGAAAMNFEKATNLFQILEDKCAAASAALSTLNYLYMPSEKMAAAHFNYQKILNKIQPYTEYHKREGRIKIGYLSQNFCRHEDFPATFGMVAAHDKNKFEITCYSLAENEDNYTNLYKKQVEHFVSVKNLSFAEIAKKIHEDKIDVLIDLSGHSQGNALPVFAYKPAPIQVSGGIACSFTTGLKAMDYFITDGIVDPPNTHENFFTEKLLYAPSQFCYALREDVPTSQYAPMTKRDYAVFGAICRWQDINDDILKIWLEILKRVPKSALLIRAEEFASNTATDKAYEHMKNLGFNMDRVLFRPPAANNMEEMTHLDVVLDPYPYSGRTSTLDALYMGVPVVTFYGERRNTRTGASILKQFGLEGLAVPINNQQDYIERAVGLVNDVDALNALHKNLRTMVRNALNIRPQLYVRALESKFEQILNEKA